MNFHLHPFDFSYDQIKRHRRIYAPPKALSKQQAKLTQKTTLEAVFASLENHLKLNPAQWRHILKQLDQSAFEVNVAQSEELTPEIVSNFKTISSLFHPTLKQDFELKKQHKQDIAVLSSKIDFSDFLKAIQREANLREILSEHQLYHTSIKRLVYKQDMQLINKQALEAMNLAKQGQKAAKIPTVTYLIEHLQLFTFQGVQLMLICFENKSVQIFEAENGYFSHEFQFQDNMLDHFSLSTLDPEQQKKLEDHKRFEDQEFKRSGLSDVEIKAIRRKREWERGTYKPSVPEFTPIIRTYHSNVEGTTIEGDKTLLDSPSRQNSILFGKTIFSNPSPYGSKKMPLTIQEQEIECEISLDSPDLNANKRKVDKKKIRTQSNAGQQISIEKQKWGLDQFSSPKNLLKRDHDEGSQSSLQNSTVQCLSSYPKSNSILRVNNLISEEVQRKQEGTQKKITLEKQVKEQKPNILGKLMCSLTKDLSIEISQGTVKDTLQKDLKLEEEENYRMKLVAENIDSKKFQQLQTLQAFGKAKNNIGAESSLIFRRSNTKSNPNSKSHFQTNPNVESPQFRFKRQQEAKQKVQARLDTIRKRQESKKRKNGGLDSNVSNDDDTKKFSETLNGGEKKHAFGLDDMLFTSNQEKKQREDFFKDLINKIQSQINFNEKHLEIIGETSKSAKQRSRTQGSKKRGRGKEDDQKDVMNNPQSIRNYLDMMWRQNNSLQLKIAKQRQRQQVFCSWIQELDQNQRNQLNTIASVQDFQPSVQRYADPIYSDHEHTDQKRTLMEMEPPGEILMKSIAIPEVAQIGEEMQRQRRQRQEERKAKLGVLGAFEHKQRIRQEQKKTYPMCIGYYEPYNVAVFALVSKEIQIHQLKQTGVRRTFSHIQSLSVQNMVVQMAVEPFKHSNYLLICVGTFSNHAKTKAKMGGPGETDSGTQEQQRSELVGFILDPKLEFEVVSSYRWMWPQEQMTSIFYNKNCGLILSSFSGFMEIFDCLTLNFSVWNNQKMSRKQDNGVGGSISTVDFSEALDMIAYGGVSGRIHFLDQTTKNFKGTIDAHSHEVIMLKFYDAQHQLISVSHNGEVGLWDAQKLTKIQFLKNGPNMTQKVISSCQFYKPQGKVLIATTKIFSYELEVDKTAKIESEQQNAVARDYLRNFIKLLQHQGIIKTKTSMQFLNNDQSKEKKLSKPKGVGRIAISEEEYFQTEFTDKTIKDYIPPAKEYNGSTLPSDLTKLVAIILDEVELVVYTVDSDFLMRVWSINTKECQRSLLIETREDQQAQMAAVGDGTGREAGYKEQKKKIQQAKSDPQRKFLILAREGGEIQVNSLYTGVLIYNNANVEPINLDYEVSALKFFLTQTKFWIAATCWEGRVAFISRPQTLQGRNFVMKKVCRCSHKGDVVALDINSENQLVTASVDNVICFWNSFVGDESKKVIFPSDIAQPQKGQTITFVAFPFPKKKDLLLIVISNGECYIMESQSENLLAFHQLDNSPSNVCTEKSERQNLETEENTRDQNGLEFSSFCKDKPLGSKRETFRNQYVLGKVSNFPTIVLKDKYLLSVNDNGHGLLHSLIYDKKHEQITGRQENPGVDQLLRAAITTKVKDIQSGITSKKIGCKTGKYQMISVRTNPVVMEELGKFKVEGGKGGVDGQNSVIQLEISLEMDIFIVAQSRGQVIGFDLKSCEKLFILNKASDFLSKQINSKLDTLLKKKSITN